MPELYAAFEFSRHGFRIRKLFEIDRRTKMSSDDFRITFGKKIYSDNKYEQKGDEIVAGRWEIFNNYNTFFDHIFFLGNQMK